MNRYSRMMGAAVTALAIAGAAACSSTSSNSGAPAPTGSGPMTSMAPSTGAPQAAVPDTITISGFAFGSPLTVAPGATITVANKDSVEHTVTADSAGGFDVSIAAGGAATFTAPTAPGSYAFHCSIHPNMHGTLIVSASGH